MKKKISLLLASLTVISPFLYGQEIDPEDLGPQDIREDAIQAQAGPFEIDLSGDYISKARVKNTFGHHNITFATYQAQLGFVYYYNPTYQEGANIQAIYEGTNLLWDSNPYYGQKQFNVLSVAFAGFSQRLPNWTWKGQAFFNFDNIEHWDGWDYMNYDFLLWGRYDVCQNVGFHIGFVAETGMKIDRVYPIIGVDWKINDKWLINLVFPMDMSILYQIDCAWSVAVQARFFEQRHRVGKHEYLSEGLWYYQSTGAEFAINYNPTDWLSANIHGGTTLGGNFKVANRHYHHKRRFNIDAAPYGGGEITLNF